eukprot:5423065-Amphidinium_carterae.1
MHVLKAVEGCKLPCPDGRSHQCAVCLKMGHSVLKVNCRQAERAMRRASPRGRDPIQLLRWQACSSWCVVWYGGIVTASSRGAFWYGGIDIWWWNCWGCKWCGYLPVKA